MPDERQTPWHAEGDAATCTVKITGEIDFSNSLEVLQWLKEFCGEPGGDLRLDLSELSYIDSSGLAVLIELRKHMKARNRAVLVAAVSDQARKLFSLTQIGGLFGI